MPLIGMEERRSGFAEVETGLSEEQAQLEAQRCLNCMNCCECFQCVQACKAGAVTEKTHASQERQIAVEVGSVILAPGFRLFNPESYETYGYGRLPNVVTSMELERILSATGPYQGHLVRPSDGQEPRKVAWIQCVGSRSLDRAGHPYCSSVCCMYAVKEAVIAREHAGGNLEAVIFYMDMRTCGKDFERYYERAKRENGIRFVRSRIHSIEEDSNRNLLIHYALDTGVISSEIFDLVVLSVALEIPDELKALSKRLGLAVDDHGFLVTESFDPVSTSRKGVFACGVITGPKDIPESVMEASAAAAAAGEALASARFSCTRPLPVVKERDINRERIRIGVFVCSCGRNIGGVVDVPEVVNYAKRLPHVVHADQNLFTCSQDAQVRMAQLIKEKQLNRVVVAACSPRTHESLFQETLISAGLNRFLLEMANIRNHDSWVHSADPDAATGKAKDLVRMAVGKSALLKPLHQKDLPVHQSALVVGGGVAGITAALTLARQGYPVHLVERSDRLGGHARKLLYTAGGEYVSRKMEMLLEALYAESRIKIHLRSMVSNVTGFVGNFKTEIQSGSHSELLEHGVAILATGALEYRPEEYCFGEHPAVVTQLELDELLQKNDIRLNQIEEVAFIQCVGSRDERRPYCSKVCCTHSLISALEILKRNPQAKVSILYRDLRAYGLRESLYQEARSRGVLFFRYAQDQKPQVIPNGKQVRVRLKDHVLGRDLILDVDLLCLATAVVPHSDQGVARFFKVPVDADGWLQEAHQKLRPVDFATEGVFLCGMAHYPKPIEESIAQAQAAAGRALTILARGVVTVGGIVASIRSEYCCGCETCIEICPFGAITYNEIEETAEVNEALCKGCGACAAACPSEAPVLYGFEQRQINAQIRCALAA